ncbi:histidine kinase [Psychromonas sp. CNPT3]|uniref:sensor histidine kinase n=1 Tax=Psychromonas sp. CNPT3 TaxID=314282 RepID=UPI00006E9A52|nr:HAMP domain-containing sensor histidine kinase [Psychromonas sp. CNPT3]AGH81131.1 histidine kinase [Psychromonas sp. CNPT3]
MTKTKHLDFNTILATTTHDMKNSLFILLQSIENLNLADNLTVAQHQDFAALHYQATRINSTLIQLLALYRDEKQQLPVFIEENSIRDILEDVMERNRLSINSQHKKIILCVDDDLNAYFDSDLITYLLSDIFINALRYSHQRITLRAFIKTPYIVIEIEDDGEGYPENMLRFNDFENMPFNASTGRSGLGLLFAQRIAAEHKNKNLEGYITLKNKEQGGGIFSLFLPE